MAAARNDLFGIGKIAHQHGAVSAALKINPDSEILKGHFPGHPVVPGACMLQIVKEVLEDALGCPLQIKKAYQLKFMTMIDPANTLAVQLDISYQYTDEGAIGITGKLSNPEAVYFKFQGSFIKI
jgi:3-hydroxyacyl-[acyl-carrier-protein] dehydratase